MAGHGPEPHAHTGDIGEDYNIGTIVTVGVVGCLLILLTILWVKAMFARSERWEWERKVVALPALSLQVSRLEQQRKLEGYEWTDPAKNRVSVPLSVAEPKVLAQLQAEQLRAMAAAATAAPPAVPGPGTAAEQPATEQGVQEGGATAANVSEGAEHPAEGGPAEEQAVP
jgi:hypothetical protein